MPCTFANPSITVRRLPVLLFAVLTSWATAAELPRVDDASDRGMSDARLARIGELGERYVAEGRLPGIMTAVARDGEIVHLSVSGTMGAGDPRPLREDAILRIYSMTKPIAAVAALMLYEEGAFQLSDPITKFLPELEGLEVYGAEGNEPVRRPPTMQQLMTHTAGFGYVFTPHPVDAAYRQANLFATEDLDAFVDAVAQLPLIAQPGEIWHYSVASTLLGAIVERISGERFGAFLSSRIFEPLDMRDTSFNVPDDKLDRVMTNHVWSPDAGAPIPLGDDSGLNFAPQGNTLEWGGGGLFSTLRDYLRFAEMLRRGGELDGVRLLSPTTVAFMASDHLVVPAAATGERPTLELGDLYIGGIGFGLGVSVITDPRAAGVLGSVGDFGWGGAAGTIFWVDPVEDVVVVSMLQVMSSPWPLRSELKVLTNAAIVESRAR